MSIRTDILTHLQADATLVAFLPSADHIRHHIVEESTAAPFLAFDLVPERTDKAKVHAGTMTFTMVDKTKNLSQTGRAVIDHVRDVVIPQLPGMVGRTRVTCAMCLRAPLYTIDHDREQVVWSQEVKINWQPNRSPL